MDNPVPRALTAAPANSAAGQRTLLRSACLNILASGVLAVAALSLAHATLNLSPWYAPRCAAVMAAIAALLLANLPQHPFHRFGLANQITLLRALLVALLVGMIGESADGRLPAVATAVATLAATLDALDGWIARRTQVTSRFGARFDMETDALLILTLCLLLWQSGKTGSWVCIAGTMRYAFIAAGWPLAWLRRDLPPRRRRQAIAVVQSVGFIIALAPFVPAVLSRALAAICLSSLAVSFAIDVHWLARQARA